MPAKQEQRLLILGASGRAGKRLCQHALNAGYQVDIIIRSPEKLAIPAQDKLKIYIGDLTNTALLRSVLSNNYAAVLSTVGIFHKTLDTPLADITQHLIDAMQASGIKRFICMSSLGAHDSKGQGNLTVKYVTSFVLKYVIKDKEKQENYIRASDLEWTIIRPPQLLDNDNSADYCRWQGNKPPQKLSWKISNFDATAAMLEALDQPETIGKAFQVSYYK
ncbi:NAD(P)-dependent oxidoreductase [Oceanicoccus sagamiensis]|uniref:NAD(P)-binding domain-containing protein n=1 Tax=Oceanicoccus sagamiensis TaxID=716816 RepID=A0A1X9N7P5_9GAMM|nr:NAD(P)-binding oxidoreductase [Oceanicoccus sagamiensis]ARN73201.1 hypothetical protein BST96_03215 [Oceanicoccus sagamiensis]